MAAKQTRNTGGGVSELSEGNAERSPRSPWLCAGPPDERDSFRTLALYLVRAGGAIPVSNF